MPFSLSRLAVAIALAALFSFSPAGADTYPSKQITILPLLAAGTGLDIIVRLYAEQLSQSFGKPVMVDNRPGSAGFTTRMNGDFT